MIRKIEKWWRESNDVTVAYIPSQLVELISLIGRLERSRL